MENDVRRIESMQMGRENHKNNGVNANGDQTRGGAI
jgi:hypothetical protein